jgi:hypothetical protein
LTAFSFARRRFAIVTRLIQNFPFREVAQMCVNPRKPHRLWFAQTPPPPVPGGVTPELDQPRLVRGAAPARTARTAREGRPKTAARLSRFGTR